MSKVAETAKGIPDRSVMSDSGKLSVSELYDLVLQLHEAERAGKHYDLRIGSPEIGLHSWAVRKGLPQPGQKHLAVLQPLHEYSYKDFEGEIPEGYGKGSVTTADKAAVVITKATPNELSFTIADKKYPENFKLIKTREKNWLLINTTPIRYDTLEANKKPKYTVINPDQAEALIDGAHAISAKIDGASSLIEILGDKIEAVSYRKDAKGRPISYALKLGLENIKPDPSLKGTVLRAEIFGTRKNKAIPVQELSGLLNATIARSRAEQAAKNINLKAALFDVVKAPGVDLSTYRKRLIAMQAILKKLPKDKFTMAPTETEPAAARKLYDAIKASKHPLTNEGVVVTELDKPGAVPMKSKFINEYDVIIRNIFPAETKSTPRAGGFEYSLPDSEQVVGRVGTGFTHETLKDMLNNPDKYIGRTARVAAMQQYDSGALRAPSFLTLHEDI
jgi:hypothetical protein